MVSVATAYSHTARRRVRSARIAAAAPTTLRMIGKWLMRRCRSAASMAGRLGARGILHRGVLLAPGAGMKITLLSDDAIRLEATPGMLTVEAESESQSFSPFHMMAGGLARSEEHTS